MENLEDSQYIAHLNGEGQDAPQQLIDHLIHVAELAESFATGPEMKQMAYQCGKYHDVGKYSEEFQEYIRGLKKGRVDHSSAGAQLLFRNREMNSVYEAMCIAGHHTGLPDMGSKLDTGEESSFCGRMKKRIPDYGAYMDELGKPEKLGIPMELLRSQNGIVNTMRMRMLFSSLVDADFLDTERYMNPHQQERGKFASIPELYAAFFDKLQEKGYLSPKNALNEKRCEILKRCIAMGKEPPGMYSLTVPTGGGKTISSFAFALEQAKKYGKERIIYVIPYTSIIEQTSYILKSFLGNQNVLEHHSQVDYDDTNEDMLQKRLAAENWDAPIIVTTNVQFFESLFANKTSRCRKLHNVANSVIIYDEAQMLPTNFLKAVTQAMECLAKEFQCTEVLCSATQPALDDFFAERPKEIMDNISEMYKFFKRTKFQDDGLQTYETIGEQISRSKQALCVCLTKAEAQKIYAAVADQDNCWYLSTDLCPLHRHKVIEEMKRRLKAGETCRVVSTSIISVGVDIDFPVVYIEETGIDSLIQGGGRCNREGKYPLEESIVHIFQTEESQKSRFLKQERQCTQVTKASVSVEISSPTAIECYFKHLYQAKEVILDEKKILEKSNRLSFAQIAKDFHLIEDHTKTVFIPLDEDAEAIANQLRLGVRNRELMRKAAKYSVNVYSGAYTHTNGLYEQLINDGYAIELDENLAILTNLEKVYDEKMGLHYHHEEGMGICW